MSKPTDVPESTKEWGMTFSGAAIKQSEERAMQDYENQRTPAASPVAPESAERSRRKATCSGECTFVENVDRYCTKHGCIILRASEHKDCAECTDKLKKLASPVAGGSADVMEQAIYEAWRVPLPDGRICPDKVTTDWLKQVLRTVAPILRAQPSAEGDGQRIAELEAYLKGVEKTSENRAVALMFWEKKAQEYLNELGVCGNVQAQLEELKDTAANLAKTINKLLRENEELLATIAEGRTK